MYVTAAFLPLPSRSSLPSSLAHEQQRCHPVTSGSPNRMTPLYHAMRRQNGRGQRYTVAVALPLPPLSPSCTPHLLQSSNVTFREVHDVDVVPYPGTIRGIVVVAEDG